MCNKERKEKLVGLKENMRTKEVCGEVGYRGRRWRRRWGGD